MRARTSKSEQVEWYNKYQNVLNEVDGRLKRQLKTTTQATTATATTTEFSQGYYLQTSDGRFAREENDSIPFGVKFNSIRFFPLLHRVPENNSHFEFFGHNLGK